jgi:microcystin-dependent protein
VPIPSATQFLPLAGGVAMTGTFDLAGPATAALEAVTLDQMTDSITAAQNTLSTTLAGQMPIGTVVSWLQGSLPTGFLALEGGAVSRTTYAALFALWGVSYGVGDGSTTFGLPDVRGRFLRGWDNGAGVDTGRTLGSTQEDEIESHKHADIVLTGSSDDNGDPGTAVLTNGAGVYGLTTIADSETGLTGGTETRPKNFSIRYLVKAL